MATNTKPSLRILDPELLLNAYAKGYFPMADSCEGEIGWYSPEARAIFPLDKFNVPRSLRQTINKKTFEIRINTQFEKVMQLCSERKETWISKEIILSYTLLHHLGFAHSVEAWKEHSLAGGLYGVALGGVFFGESMFSRVRDASKVALVALVERLNQQGFELLDTQFMTPHLARFGAIEISRNEYLRLLKKSINKQCNFIE
ncbi:MAG: leucyl/phenylalanyl-tRNA--protein transferase [Ignavibacteriae bacterium]|nr:leucyl/phenylalanyl-tRNA--protein transferase [Ignavibacteriota bacterium]